MGLGHNHDRLIGDIDAFIAGRELPLVTFAKRQRKEDVARPFFAGVQPDADAVVLVGKAQERVMGWRGFKDGGNSGHPHFAYRRQALFVNHFYFYVWDRDGGRRSSSCAPTRPIRCGCGATVTSGPNSNSPKPTSTSRHSTTASGRWLTRPERDKSARGSAPITSAGLSANGCACCRVRSPPSMQRSGAITSGPCVRSSSPTPPCSIGPPGKSVVRSRHPRPPRPRTTRAGVAHLRPARPSPRPEPDPGEVRDRGHHSRRRPPHPDPLPDLQGEGVLQRASRLASGDHDQ